LASNNTSSILPISGNASTPFSSSKTNVSISTTSSHYRASSRYEVKCYDILSQLKASLHDYKEKYQLGSDTTSNDFEDSLDKFLFFIDESKADIRKTGKLVGVNKQQSLVLLSQRDDMRRQVKEGERFCSQKESTPSYWEALKCQPLDDESSNERRALSVKVHCVKKTLNVASTMTSIIEKSYNFSSSSGCDNQNLPRALSKLKRESILSPTSQRKIRHGRIELFKALKSYYLASHDISKDLLPVLKEKVDNFVKIADDKSNKRSLSRVKKIASPFPNKISSFLSPKKKASSSLIKARPLPQFESKSNKLSEEKKETSRILRAKKRQIEINMSIQKISELQDTTPLSSFENLSVVVESPLADSKMDRSWRKRVDSYLMTTPTKSLVSSHNDSHVLSGLSVEATKLFSASPQREKTSSKELIRFNQVKFSKPHERKVVNVERAVDKVLGMFFLGPFLFLCL